jgi:pyruvate dehydrogenase E2 component (dihydrolipoamide acetyltransferase)
VNASWRDGAIVQHARVHVGVAVAGLGAPVLPVIRDADTLPLGTIAWATRELTRQARNGTLPPKATRGATFAVSKLGLQDVDGPRVLDPARAAVLAVGPVRVEPAVADGDLVEPRVLRLRLTCDGRVLDEAAASSFLEHLAGYLEVPLALAL